MGQLSVRVDRDRCMGTGACAFAVPEVFAVDDTGRAVVVGLADDGDDRVREAVAECPMDALVLEEAS